LVLILGTLQHHWVVPKAVIKTMLSASGPKKGQSACFNEYMASYQHDWENMILEEQDYGKGYRDPKSTITQSSPRDDDLTF
jgi:hypothetical protein